MRRNILHSDLNCFYASVEMMLDPALRGEAVAVCGSKEDRHGIVLAKSEKAKRAGVKTGMANWQAQRLCPGLIVVSPQYEQYLKYSRLVQAIYKRYTDRVEPYGMDECWLDLTGDRRFGADPTAGAEEIRRVVREELGLTVSIGVSFNKVFAKLGSDMKKPDAVTTIPPEKMREMIWPLPVSDLLFAGRATTAKLMRYSIYTIGDLAKTDPSFLEERLGKNGMTLWLFANGEDHAGVKPVEYELPIKSVGHGITATEDLTTEEQVDRIFLFLAQDVGHRLRQHELSATGVQISVKDNALSCKQYQAQLAFPTQCAGELASLARQLFHENYGWALPVRAVTVRAIGLLPQRTPTQLMLFDDVRQHIRRDEVEKTVDTLRARFGDWSVYPASLMGDLLTPGHGEHSVTLPGMLYQ